MKKLSEYFYGDYAKKDDTAIVMEIEKRKDNSELSTTDIVLHIAYEIDSDWLELVE